MARLAAGIPDRRNMQVIPEGRPVVLVVQQLHGDGPVGSQSFSQPLHLGPVRSRALQKSAVPAYHLLPAQRGMSMFLHMLILRKHQSTFSYLPRADHPQHPP